LFSPWYSWKIAELALNNNYSLTFNVVSSNPAHGMVWLAAGWLFSPGTPFPNSQR
jgi:hypothetical protein